ncbi:lipoprotein [Mycoavidus cysteinexigens]|uniref:Lipoprotein n=1 Tax=Mycoavidus cysteinexigens TaxID=1553431 RepID=A0A2Z6ESQ4_9BURK|nr:VacJ family lipoprotein [Mycoavidus cysteinexigens]BBE08444.1 lipoprotein [Mycoavidus cysteinexigens]GAM52842.1 nucleoside ABC transporter, periplasmic nucleoside-binding protein [bacterium endosymbiont of Mortierella elongata FMR23-6]GLR00950.1 lipoprotein [Mycoavidus cysteinexigens]
MKALSKVTMSVGLSLRRIALCSLVLGLAACASVQAPTKSDPFESMNRTIFEFNDAVDRFALKPVAKAYNRTLPKGVRTSVANFFSNLGDVSVMANNLLQGKITAGTEDLMRISINTLFGIGGLFDVASAAGLPKHQADLGLTLGHYGVASGPYLVLPIFGPSTLRDMTGLLVGREVDPMTYIDPVALRNQAYGLRVVNVRASLLDANDLLEDAALDKYSFVRQAYLQRRQYLIYDGNPPPPEYEDADDDVPGYDTEAESAVPHTAQPEVAEKEELAPQGARVELLDEKETPAEANKSIPASQGLPPLRTFPSLRLP